MDAYVVILHEHSQAVSSAWCETILCILESKTTPRQPIFLIWLLGNCRPILHERLCLTVWSTFPCGSFFCVRGGRFSSVPNFKVALLPPLFCIVTPPIPTQFIYLCNSVSEAYPFPESFAMSYGQPQSYDEEQSCWYPDGVLSPHDTPCSDLELSNGGAVPCCGPGRICMPNKLCAPNATQSMTVRGSCTDQTYLDPNCPKICIERWYSYTCTPCALL